MLWKKHFKIPDIIYLLIPLLVVLEVADGVFTYLSVGNQVVQEGNPLMQDIAGTGNFVIMKIAGAFLCALLLWLLHKRFPRVSLISTSSVVIFYTIVFSWNLSVLL